MSVSSQCFAVLMQVNMNLFIVLTVFAFITVAKGKLHVLLLYRNSVHLMNFSKTIPKKDFARSKVLILHRFNTFDY